MNIITCNVFINKLFCFVGASAPNPDLLFVLPQKVSKKVKTAPASLEKLMLSWLKLSKLAPSSLKQGQFQTPTSLVFRFTGRGHSLANFVQFNIIYLFIENSDQMHYSDLQISKSR